MPLTAYWNPDDEKHREWKESFGFNDDDVINDNRSDDYQGEKKLPVIVVDVPDCSFTETVPEWYNPVTGEELGEQTVTINCDSHIGTYYFETRSQYDDWITNTLNALADKVDSPDGETNILTLDQLPDLPTWRNRDETD